MKFKGLPRDVSDGLFVASMVTAALVGIFFAGWKIAGLPFVPFDSFDWLTRVLPGRVLGFGIGIMVDVIRELHLGPTSETAKTVEHAIAIAGLFVMGVAGGTILFSILRTRRKVHPVFLGLVLGIVLAVPAMLISVHASETATVDQALRAAWILVAFLAWGAILGRVGQQLIGIETANSTVESATEPRVERIDRRHFLVKLGGSAAAITVVGALVGEFAETRRKESAMMAASEPIRWSATHPLPNAAAAVKPAPGTRPEFTSLENHYRIDINAIPPKVDGATLAFEDHRARRATAFSNPRTVAWLRADAPVCHALVHLKSCGRRFDRHNALDWGQPTAAAARSPVAADSDTFEDSIGRRVFRSGRTRCGQSGRTDHADIRVGWCAAEA